ncbi:unnamed protein product [Caretta caretta]
MRYLRGFRRCGLEKNVGQVPCGGRGNHRSVEVLCEDGVRFGKEPVKLKYDCGGHEVLVSQNGSGFDVRKPFPSVRSEDIGVTGE